MMSFQINDIRSQIYALLYKEMPESYIDNQFDKFILDHLAELEGETLSLEEETILNSIKRQNAEAKKNVV
jgi:hypothetical protein